MRSIFSRSPARDSCATPPPPVYIRVYAIPTLLYTPLPLMLLLLRAFSSADFAIRAPPPAHDRPRSSPQDSSREPFIFVFVVRTFFPPRSLAALTSRHATRSVFRAHRRVLNRNNACAPPPDTCSTYRHCVGHEGCFRKRPARTKNNERLKNYFKYLPVGFKCNTYHSGTLRLLRNLAKISNKAV